MTSARTAALVLTLTTLAAAPALAQTGALTPLPSRPPGSTLPSTAAPSLLPSTTPSSPLLTPAPPVGVPSPVSPSTVLPSSLAPPSSSTDLGATLATPPAPIPQTEPRLGPSQGQPLTPSLADPRTGVPR